ncbi:hypothetical protein GCM10010401_07180 [Rarobacter faecitabidus]|uniref:Uncharacterized protein n=1 Tax=Rarobacter faecitabidus TaxID=13243 RepID=A0A542Z845_RARFA|nr:hypothetical protein [Rarobacter faecitabidus]TQL56523.1 hypothetical protein FB461_2409 [Rarobacter faecitabidus]
MNFKKALKAEYALAVARHKEAIAESRMADDALSLAHAEAEAAQGRSFDARHALTAASDREQRLLAVAKDYGVKVEESA